MLEDSNVQRVIKNYTEPLQKQISMMQIELMALKQKINISDVICIYSPFPQTLKAGKKYRILAKHKDIVAVIDETKELATYNKCYFDSHNCP